jgi:hypothetical protein
MAVKKKSAAKKKAPKKKASAKKKASKKKAPYHPGGVENHPPGYHTVPDGYRDRNIRPPDSPWYSTPEQRREALKRMPPGWKPKNNPNWTPTSPTAEERKAKSSGGKSIRASPKATKKKAPAKKKKAAKKKGK